MHATRDSWSLRLDAALRLAQSGATQAAAAELSMLCKERPGEALPHLLLATVHQQAGELPLALREIESALALAPDDPNALRVKARLLLSTARHAEAGACAKRILERMPGHPGALFDLASALEGEQRWHEAVAAGVMAVAAQPGDAAARRLLARCRLMAGDSDAALEEGLHPAVLAHAESALAIADDFAARGLHAHRIALLRRLAARNRGDYACVMALADALQAARQTSEAVEWARRAMALRPDAVRPRLLDAAAAIERGQIRQGLAVFEKLLAAGRLDAVDEQRYLIALHYDPDQQPDAMYDAHVGWAKRHVQSPDAHFDAGPGERLRIGWLSPRFAEGPVARFLTGPLAAFDRTRHQHVLLELHPLRDACTDALEGLCDEVADVHGLDDDALRDRLRALRLDVLVDLAGHAPFGRPGVLAQRVAPVQVSWLDWFDTTGLPNMDAWISDPWLSPADSPQRFTERLLRLQSGRFCYTPPEFAPDAAYDGDGVTRFVSCNRTAKLNDAVVATWARILDAVPQSRLLLGGGDLDDAGARSFLLERFRARGIAASRLEIQGRVDYPSLLATYRRTDIALDPFPFSGCTTSCDALWMGVPVITLPGWSVVSRQTASLSWRLDQANWVAESPDAYVARAVELADDVNGLRRGRAALRNAVARHLCDASAQAAELAGVLQRLVVERRRGNPAGGRA